MYPGQLQTAGGTSLTSERHFERARHSSYSDPRAEAAEEVIRVGPGNPRFSAPDDVT